jgi:hypothetical protein
MFCGLVVVGCVAQAHAATGLEFQVSLKKDLMATPQTGRLLVILSRTKNPEPRTIIGSTGLDAPYVIAGDVANLAPGTSSTLDQRNITSPITNLSELPAGDYFAQALLSVNHDLRAADAPGNFYSSVRKLHIESGHQGAFDLELSRQIPGEQMQRDTKLVRYVKIQSRLLSEFYQRPIYLRAGIILPRDFSREPNRNYPLWVRIGGWGARYTAVSNLMSDDSEFHKNWMADGTPRMILLQLDGAGPLGDPYQVNSANNGPYGDAITQELIPQVEKMFRGIGEPRARVLSGLSTGGWVSLALQIFYPDFFNGTWTFCPDPVDFRAFELVNIYEDQNAYTNSFGYERPSDRTILGDVRLTMRRELQGENIMGEGDSWTMSGGQWCTWNATYGPRGADGRPSVLWDPQTGKIDHAVAEAWKKYDLRLVLQNNWATLGPKLQGKLHISVGEADNYFLNNAVHLLDHCLWPGQRPCVDGPDDVANDVRDGGGHGRPAG